MEARLRKKMEPLVVMIGKDSREPLSFAVTARSMLAHSSRKLLIVPLSLAELVRADFYRRPTVRAADGALMDVISNLPLSTEFALTRFWVPYLSGYAGWSLFVDGDWLFRDDVAKLFALADRSKAVMVVKHFHDRREAVKMDGQAQKKYERKLWSAMMLFNCAHPACSTLDLEFLNTAHRHDLHQFRWCSRNGEVGNLPENWHVVDMEVAGYHLTCGTPELGVWGGQFDDEWLSYLSHDERQRLGVPR